MEACQVLFAHRACLPSSGEGLGQVLFAHEACPQSSGERLDRFFLCTRHAHRVLVKDLTGYVCAQGMPTKFW